MRFLRRWWLRRQRARALRRIAKLRRFIQPLGAIRQFIYLDVVALRSLYVSRYGPEDARTLITDSRTREAELSGSVSQAVPGLYSAKLAPLLRSSASESLQIERVASEQSLFRDFLDREEHAGADGQLWDGTPDASGKLTVNPRSLQRGELIQIRVRLQADFTYRISTFASAISSLAGDDFGFVVPGSVQALQIASLMRQLLIEQAPIESELVDWGWDEVAGQLVARTERSVPLHLVALTTTANYWVDVRRALFGDAVCVVLVRVAEDVPSLNWTPLKLFGAARGIPGFEQLDESIAQMGEALEPSTIQVGNELPLFEEILSEYTRARAAAAARDVPLIDLGALVDIIKEREVSATAILEALDVIDSELGGQGESEEGRERIAELRSSALSALLESSRESTGTAHPKAAAPSKRYVVGEVVAMYW